ncbi:MAG: methylamine utilization protein [Sphingobacteriales bacterium]|nr:MAG: methylamine utilization protein [Sphingobacteriales bacterium]
MIKQPIRYLVLSLLFFTFSCRAYDLQVRVLTVDNKPLADAVVYVESTAENFPAPTKMAVMDQKNKAFVPHVLAVPVGTKVDFPNTDSVNHYVYSFSEIKKFQFKLFKGDLEKHQTQLDKPGLITLGCNIHDFMLGYIFVAPTPYVGVSNSEGIVDLKLPDNGDVNVAIWHLPAEKTFGLSDLYEDLIVRTPNFGVNLPHKTYTKKIRNYLGVPHLSLSGYSKY